MASKYVRETWLEDGSAVTHRKEQHQALMGLFHELLKKQSVGQPYSLQKTETKQTLTADRILKCHGADSNRILNFKSSFITELS